MRDYRNEHILELSVFPKEYTIQMAVNNYDIIRRGTATYNAVRLQLFIYHVENNIPDKVRITDYGIDGYPTLSILQYDGNYVTFTLRFIPFENENVSYDTFYGDSIIQRLRMKNSKLLRDYLLHTFDDKEIPILIEPLLRLI